MTTLALAEKICDCLSDAEWQVHEMHPHHRSVRYRVAIGRQVFVVRCEACAPDKERPAV